MSGRIYLVSLAVLLVIFMVNSIDGRSFASRHSVERRIMDRRLVKPQARSHHLNVSLDTLSFSGHWISNYHRWSLEINESNISSCNFSSSKNISSFVKHMTSIWCCRIGWNRWISSCYLHRFNLFSNQIIRTRMRNKSDQCFEHIKYVQIVEYFWVCSNSMMSSVSTMNIGGKSIGSRDHCIKIWFYSFVLFI